MTVMCFLTSSVWYDPSADASHPKSPVVKRVTPERVRPRPVTALPLPFRRTSWTKKGETVKCHDLFKSWKINANNVYA